MNNRYQSEETSITISLLKLERSFKKLSLEKEEETKKRVGTNNTKTYLRYTLLFIFPFHSLRKGRTVGHFSLGSPNERKTSVRDKN